MQIFKTAGSNYPKTLNTHDSDIITRNNRMIGTVSCSICEITSQNRGKYAYSTDILIISRLFTFVKQYNTFFRTHKTKARCLSGLLTCLVEPRGIVAIAFWLFIFTSALRKIA